jgi:uncharacterized OB-fold protein/3-oxoacyl-[acyl-carrier-protein] synthase III
MGVEAARNALANLPSELTPQRVLFATANPAYLDKTNATAIHAALGLPSSAAALDVGGAVRSGVGAMMLATQATVPTLVVVSDIRTGLPGGADEREGGDGAAAFVMASETTAGDAMQVRPIAVASATAEFLDRWRLPGEPASRQWEERFGEHAYVPLGESALTEALKTAGVTVPGLSRLIVAGPHGRAVKRVAGAAGAKKETIADDLFAMVGNTGTAHAGLMFAAALDGAQADDLIAVVSLADGADASVWRVTGASRRPAGVAAQLAGGGRVSYPTFLTWRGFLRREPPRRPDPQAPEAPPARRAEAWKFGFTGSRCQSCGTRHLPPQRVCVKCHAVDRMAPERLADVPATIATFTVDRLAFSPSPPMVVAVLDFEGGGRFQSEMTDVDPKSVKIGDRVTMTFRRLITAGGVHNYFWKAKPFPP